MKRFEKNIVDRKDLVNRLKDITGLEAVYTRVPRCAYEIGAFTVEMDGVLTCGDVADEAIIRMLKDEGLIGEELTGQGDDVATSAPDPDETGFVSMEDAEPPVTEEAETDVDAEPETEHPAEVDAVTDEATDSEYDPISDEEYDQEAEEESAASLGIRDDAGNPGTDSDMNQEDTVPEDAEPEDAAPENVHSEEDAEPNDEEPEDVEPDETDHSVEAEADTAGDGEAMPTELAISLPMNAYTGESLRRLVNLIYSQGALLTKATGGSFRVSKELIEAMDAAGTPISAEDFSIQLTEYTAEHGGLDGIALEGDRVTFTGFPMTEDADRMAAFRMLAAAMNRQAIDQKRIQAKDIVTESEKYAFRNWLVRIGLGAAEFKTARAVLLENLGGHTAFRNKAEEARWKARQKEKRDSVRAAAQTIEAESLTSEAVPARQEPVAEEVEAVIEALETENGEA